MELDTIVQADASDYIATLPDDSVDCVVTSPPYWGLRDYDAEGQIGLEETFDEFIARLVTLFADMRRALKPSGVFFMNMGDAYAGGGRDANTKSNLQRGNSGSLTAQRRTPTGFKPKDMLLQPHRLAIALQEDGWWVRDTIIWHKPNPMPQSVRDRTTTAHEYVFMLTKQGRYWYDHEAIREKAISSNPEHEHYRANGKSDSRKKHMGDIGMVKPAFGNEGLKRFVTRNRRSVWTIATQPLSYNHYASFPEALIEPMILAGCPDKVCVECGAPWVRVVEKEYLSSPNYTGIENGRYTKGRGRNVTRMGDGMKTTTTGWEPTCDHDAPVRPGLVFDPFMGSGTTALVARKHGRHYIGCEINPDYVAIADHRLQQSDPYRAQEVSDGITQLSLFEEVQ